MKTLALIILLGVASSSAWQGVFGKMTPQQVDLIATQVFSELKTTP